MVENKIKDMLARKGISAAALSREMPDMDKVCMCFITGGKAMPTRSGMQAMCGILGCKPTDLYREEELNLNTEESRAEAPAGFPFDRETEEVVRVAKAAGVSTETIKALAPINGMEAPDQFRPAETPWRGRGHEGQVELRVWMKPEEKQALEKAVIGLGYRSTTEWLREMYRQTVKQYLALNLNGNIITHFVPPLAANEAGASGTST